jgi:hypothetical protein
VSVDKDIHFLEVGVTRVIQKPSHVAVPSESVRRGEKDEGTRGGGRVRGLTWRRW